MQARRKQAGPAAPSGDLYDSVDPATGLGAVEVIRRRQVHGLNTLGEAKRPSWVSLLAAQFKSLLTLILVGAAALSTFFGDTSEAVAILAVVLFNSAVGFIAESRAVKAMDALRQMGRATTRVRRDGKIVTVPDEELVPGDIVILEAGDVVTADLRLLECTQMQCDESLLSGESVPVAKQAAPLPGPMPEAAGLATAYKGTSVTRGACVGIVTATGAATELGQIAEVTEAAEGATSPLEARLQHLTHQLLIAVLVLMTLLTIAGIVAGRDALLMVKTGVALAVAAIPEGLPIVATLALARGMWKLAARNALIERLSAVETLGSVTLIITDKTGTLTENRMTVTALMATDMPGQDNLKTPGPYGLKALRVCALCYSGDNPEALSDPMETALVVAASGAGQHSRDLEATFPRIAEHSFDPALRMMATVHRTADGLFLYAVKGAPETVLGAANMCGDAPMTDAERKEWLEHMRALARQGLRVLALAEKTAPSSDAPPYEGLTFLGLVGLEDPPRADAAHAVAAAQAAGIRVVMATGDSVETGHSVARAVGITRDEDAAVLRGDMMTDENPTDHSLLLGADILARMRPQQKLSLIDLHQQHGAVVAMTGDGVNDAPALKKADVGIAMGKRGTEVAKQAADMILKDDAFASIVVAIQQGRVIFANIRKFVVYLLSCNLSEVLVVTVAVLAGLPLPLLPLQILFLNLVTDVFPALALGFGRGDSEILHRPPRPKSEGLLQPRHWQAIVGYAVVMTASVSLAFLWALDHGSGQAAYANTVAFLTLALGQLWHVFNMRSRKAAFLANQVTLNGLVWGAIALCLVLMALAVFWSPVSTVLQLQPLDRQGWLVVLGASFLPLLLGQLAKTLAARNGKQRVTS